MSTTEVKDDKRIILSLTDWNERRRKLELQHDTKRTEKIDRRVATVRSYRKELANKIIANLADQGFFSDEAVEPAKKSVLSSLDTVYPPSYY